jgi:rhodanese-related sulfurtransferase
MNMEESGGSRTIGLEEARTRMGTDATVLDIRPDEEWQSVGNIPGARACSVDDAAEAVKEIDEDRTVIVVCADGERSAEVAERLRDAGRDAVSLEGGMAAWADSSLPMQPTEDPALASDPGSVGDESSGEFDESREDSEDETSEDETSSASESESPDVSVARGEPAS